MPQLRGTKPFATEFTVKGKKHCLSVKITVYDLFLFIFIIYLFH